MTDRDHGDALRLHVRVEMSLDVDTDSAGAFVEDGVFGLVIDQSAHRHSLLFATAEDIVPVVLGVPAALTVDEVFESDLAEELSEVILRDVLGELILFGIWIDELVSQCSVGEVRSLRNVEDLFEWGFVQLTSINGPELSHDSEQ